MRNFVKAFALTALVACVSAHAARAEVVWDQNYVNQNSGTVVRGEHLNTNFEGNANLKAADIKKLQQALATRGFYKGRIDGLWGPVTTQAILDYQSVHEQPLTGTMTPGTLSDLGIKVNMTNYRQ